ncbi:MAG: hydroxymethylbilane synthase, partial [Desulfuromonadales bacterium]|nr:hydroxymethylbilane synthase [Desulfuromonadales bacterium]
AVIAERAVLATLEGGCQVPIAAFGTVAGEQLDLIGLVSSVDGQNMLKKTMHCHVDQAKETGVALAKQLLAAGAGSILNEVYGCDTFADKD